MYFCRKCCPGQIWSCIFTRCYLPWTSCQVPALRLLYTVGHQRSKYSLYQSKQAEVVKNKTSWSAKLDTFISFAHTDDPSFLQYGFFMGSSSILTVAHTLRAATDCPPFSTLMVRSRLFVTLKPMHSFSQIFATLSLDVEDNDEI